MSADGPPGIDAAPGDPARQVSTLSKVEQAMEGLAFHNHHGLRPSHRYADNEIEIKDEDRFRPWLMSILNTTLFEKVMGLIIIFNFVVIAMQVDAEADCNPLPQEFPTHDDCVSSLPYSRILFVTVVTLMVIYTVEASCRLYVERWLYFNSHWNLLDLFVVITGWVGEIVFGSSAFSFLRILRTVRLARMFRVLISFPELYYMLSSLMSLFKSLVFASVMLFGLLSLWSIIMVQYIHPIATGIDWEFYGCERCSRAYGGIMQSNLTLWQHLVMGDSWGMINIPIIEQEPWTAALLCSVVITVVLGLMNLIMAVILQRAEDARDNDKKIIALQKAKELEESKRELVKFCAQLDQDQSGHIDLQELVHAWNTQHEFRQVMQSMDIHEDDLEIVFRVLDKDNSGEVTYHEFCDELCKIRSRDLNTMISIMKLSISEIGQQVHKLVVISGSQHAAPPMMSQAPSHFAAEPPMKTPPAAPAAPESASADTSPTLAGRLFSELLGADPGGTLLRDEVAGLTTDVLMAHAQELTALKLNVADYFEKQVSMLVVALREDWTKSNSGACRPPAAAPPAGLSNGLSNGQSYGNGGVTRSGGVTGGPAPPEKQYGWPGGEAREPNGFVSAASTRQAPLGARVSVASLRRAHLGGGGQRDPAMSVTFSNVVGLRDPGAGGPSLGGGQPGGEDMSRIRTSRV